MTTLKQFTLAALVLLLTSVAGMGQDSPVREGSKSTSSEITISVIEGGVRFAALGSFGKMRLEIFNADSASLYNSDFRAANVQDWKLADKFGQPLPDGTYLCVVTIRDLSGRLSTKQSPIMIKGGQVSLQMLDTTAPTVIDQEKSLAPMLEPTKNSITAIANSGEEGQVVTTHSALTFRLGDFFGGRDKEFMRLTNDGNLGLGTSNPQAKLDVAGTIRAREGFVFSDGSRLNVTDRGALTLTSNNGAKTLTLSNGGGIITPSITGTGSQNKLSKWTDNSGTLGDSVVTELSGNIGIGTPTPGQTLDVAGTGVFSGNQTPPAFSGVLDIATTVTNNNVNISGIRMRNTFNGNFSTQQALDVAPTFAPSASITMARGFTSASFFAPPSGVNIGKARGGNAATVYGVCNCPYGTVTTGETFALDPPVQLSTLTPTNQFGLHIYNQGLPGTGTSYGLYVDSQAGSTNNYAAIFAGGNVGIGTTSPQSPLDVNGNMNVTGNATVSGNIAARYQDIAEWTASRTQLSAGTVVILDSTKPNSVMASNRSYDTRVAGVVSEKPGLILGEGGKGRVLVATTGRVKVRVDARQHPIHIGDLLVASNVPGLAMKSVPMRMRGKLMHRPGTIIGKALEPLEKGEGTVLTLLSLQ